MILKAEDFISLCYSVPSLCPSV